MKPEFVRGFRATDAEAVDGLLQAAFGGPREAAMVRDLRASGEMVIELVMPWEGAIIGDVALSRMVAPDGWLCLAPMAIAEAWSGRGLGVRLAKSAVALAAGRTVVVVGKPSLYARAGFSLNRAARLTSSYPIDHTLIARPDDDVPEGTLIYPAAFEGV